MDLSKYLKRRTLWKHGLPQQGTDRTEFDKSLAAGTTLEVKSFSPGVYVSNHLPGEGGGYNPQELSLRLTGYFLTEHILTHSAWKGNTRLEDLIAWGLKEKHIQRLQDGTEPYYLSPEKPSQFEWLLWQSRAVALDVSDPAISNEIKLAQIGLLKEEVSRVSGTWSKRKGQGKSSGDTVLTRYERQARDGVNSNLKFIFGALSIPSANQFYPEYSPEAKAASVKTGIVFDEAWQKPSDAVVPSVDHDPFFDEEEEEDVYVSPVSEESRELARKCLTSFFLFEQGSQIIANLRSAKLQPGLRTVEPGVALSLPESVQKQYNLPAGLAYVKSVPGVATPGGKPERSYIYAKVENGVVLEGPENQVLVNAEAHGEIRKATAPWLKMPEGLPQKARYLQAHRKGRHPNMVLTYSYMDENHKVVTIGDKQHREVLKLNPEHVSINTRGKIDDLFSNFFVDEVKPHYRGYLPESREERIILRDRVREELQPHIAKAWEEIEASKGSLDQRTEIVKQHYSNWLHIFQPREMGAVAPRIFSEMKTAHSDTIHDMVSQRASEVALVKYMEAVKGENEAPNYKNYGLSGRYKTWRTQIMGEGGSKLFNERMNNAQTWAKEAFGSLEALIPETHQTEKVLAHFSQNAGEELLDLTEKRGIPKTKGLVGLSEYINPISILVFYERRLQHLRWNYHFDRDLPDVNLSRVSKAAENKKVAQQNQIARRPEVTEVEAPELDL